MFSSRSRRRSPPLLPGSASILAEAAHSWADTGNGLALFGLIVARAVNAF
jgi:hypothetical protein